MSFDTALTFFVAVFIFAVTPGPGTFALMARGLVSSAKSCLPMAFGMTVSDIIYLLLACWGLAVVAEMWSEFFVVVRLVGAAYLLYLAYCMWTAPVTGFDQDAKAEHGSTWSRSFVEGFLISASNPKVILFYIAFLPGFMELSKLTREDILLAVALTVVGLMSGLMLVSFCATRTSRMLQSSGARKKINRFAGSVMAGAAVFLAAKG